MIGHDRLKELRIINLIDIESNKCYWSFIKLSDICYFPNPPKVISEIPCTNWQLNILEEGWAAIEVRVWSPKDASSNYLRPMTVYIRSYLNSGLP